MNWIELIICPEHGLFGLMLRASRNLPLWRDIIMASITVARTAVVR